VTYSLIMFPASSSFRQCATSVHQSVLPCGQEFFLVWIIVGDRVSKEGRQVDFGT
jgi:hypothetical protein